MEEFLRYAVGAVIVIVACGLAVVKIDAWHVDWRASRNRIRTVKRRVAEFQKERGQ